MNGALRSRPLRIRARVVIASLIALLVAAALLSLGLGAFPLSPADLVATVLGQGEERQAFVLASLRGPRLVLGALVGAALGLSGALLQSVVRNPLASPDIIGISGGASAAAVAALLMGGASGLLLAGAAVGGAVVTALVLGALSWRNGIGGDRFVLIGVGIAFLFSGLIGMLLARADLNDAGSAFRWIIGSLGGAGWVQVAVVGGAVLALLPVLLLIGRPLRILELGDDAASALGSRVTAVRVLAIAACVVLAAVATSATGPVAFVAFVSAPIVRRLLRTNAPSLLPAALLGAFIVTAADIIAQHLLAGRLEVPVGVVTAVIGAPYLLWLLATSHRPAGGTR